MTLENCGGFVGCLKNSDSRLIYMCKLKQAIAQIQVRLCFPFPLEAHVQEIKCLLPGAEKLHQRGFSDGSKEIHHLLATQVMLSLVRMKNFSFQFVLNVKMAKVSMRSHCCYLVL